ncbi:hypothetical protein AKJ59_00475 [candidate division MSBL1 archaeon SCGC-AAA385M02]|uniref:Uncharacterized protein n=1 Tax=candidate division MSBL1 archaeon SCGC-AAA385M02 TaxID=1698287 RepID=A0A133VQT1_9EURY|nr:hypothetical protein AKJ59_00475 [candidate division MSBL1 archaeon SCGC-AAA385M02]
MKEDKFMLLARKLYLDTPRWWSIEELKKYWIPRANELIELIIKNKFKPSCPVCGSNDTEVAWRPKNSFGWDANLVGVNCNSCGKGFFAHKEET